jgi:hypothetical protein
VITLKVYVWRRGLSFWAAAVMLRNRRIFPLFLVFPFSADPSHTSYCLRPLTKIN